jgi:hypothetical protein
LEDPLGPVAVVFDQLREQSHGLSFGVEG